MENASYVERVRVMPSTFIVVRVERAPIVGNLVGRTRAVVGVEIDGVDMARHRIGRSPSAGMATRPGDARLWAWANAGREVMRASTAYAAEMHHRRVMRERLGGSGMAYRATRGAAGLVIGLDVWRAWCARSPERHAEPRAVCEAWVRDGDAELVRRIADDRALEGAQWEERLADVWLERNAARLVRMAGEAVLG